MKIAAVNLTSGGFSGGYRKYLQYLLPLLQKEKGVERIDHFFPPNADPQLVRGFSNIYSWPAGDGWTGWRSLRARIREISPNVVFFPTGRWIDCGPIPTVVMVRNMEPLLAPFGGNPIPECLKNIFRSRSARKACRKATRVIAVSEFVQEFLETKWKIPRPKMGVVYHGIEAPIPEEQACWKEAPEGLEGQKFLFTAGSIRPARGLEDLIRASAIAFSPTNPCRIVVGGESDPGLESHLRRLKGLAETLGVASRFAWVGKLTMVQMAWCFYKAVGFVMTSRAEACPNLALEAMNYGCRVISTRQPPMPEFFGENARYYPPFAAEELAVLLREVTEGPPPMTELRLKAQQRAREFTWELTAHNTTEQLRKAALMASH